MCLELVDEDDARAVYLRVYSRTWAEVEESLAAHRRVRPEHRVELTSDGWVCLGTRDDACCVIGRVGEAPVELAE